MASKKDNDDVKRLVQRQGEAKERVWETIDSIETDIEQRRMEQEKIRRYTIASAPWNEEPADGEIWTAVMTMENRNALKELLEEQPADELDKWAWMVMQLRDVLDPEQDVYGYWQQIDWLIEGLL